MGLRSSGGTKVIPAAPAISMIAVGLVFPTIAYSQTTFSPSGPVTFTCSSFPPSPFASACTAVSYTHLYKVDKALYDLLINARCIYTSIMEFHRLQNWETLARELTEAGVALIFDVETSTFDRWDDPLFSYADLLFFNEEGWKKFKNRCV